MRPWISKASKWLLASGRARNALVPFDVACDCGASVQGVRQVRWQALRCPACHREVFVLPLSALPPVPSDGAAPSGVLGTSGSHGYGRNRRWVLTIGILHAGILATAIGLGWYFWTFTGPVTPADPADILEKFRQHRATGQFALAAGNYQSAVEELDLANAARMRQPSLFTPAENRNLVHLRRQAQLLADLSGESLEEILRSMEGLDDREVQAIFLRRHRDKTVIFLASVRRDAHGRHTMDYPLFDGARLDLDDLKMLKALPLQEPQLLLFGVRLSGVRRQPSGGWLLLLDAGSGVLVTDPGAAASCCFQAANQIELQDVLRRQTAWIDQP